MLEPGLKVGTASPGTSPVPSARRGFHETWNLQRPSLVDPKISKPRRSSRSPPCRWEPEPDRESTRGNRVHTLRVLPLCKGLAFAFRLRRRSVMALLPTQTGRHSLLILYCCHLSELRGTQDCADLQRRRLSCCLDKSNPLLLDFLSAVQVASLSLEDHTVASRSRSQTHSRYLSTARTTGGGASRRCRKSACPSTLREIVRVCYAPWWPHGQPDFKPLI